MALQLATASSRRDRAATPKIFFARCARGQAHSVPIEARRSYDGAWRTLDDVLAPREVQTEASAVPSMMPYTACAVGDDDGFALVTCSRKRSSGLAWRRQPCLMRTCVVCDARSRSPCVNALSLTAECSGRMHVRRRVRERVLWALGSGHNHHGRLLLWGQQSRLTKSIFEYVILAVVSLSPHTSTCVPGPVGEVRSAGRRGRLTATTC